MFKKLTLITLRILLGILFIFSGIIKLYPIEPFELTFVDVGIASWQVAPYFARILIGLEIFLGLMLILNVRLKKFTIKATALLLIFFIVYLIYAIVTKGNDGNCGCFGTFFEMTPLQSIVKNVIMLLVLALLYKAPEQYEWKKKWIIPVLVIASISTPFILYPLDWVYYQAIDTGFVGKRLPLEKLPELKINNQPVDLNKGKHILAFFSLSCPHCKIAARKLAIIAKKTKTYPITVVFMGGDKETVELFFADTDSRFPYVMYDTEGFLDMSGPYLPSIYLVDEGVVKKRWGNLDLNVADFTIQ
jgi:uncharacterized membrane protein YphA (DoxX/SURF4 family)